MMFLHVLPELRVVIYPLMIWGFWSIVRRQNVFFNGFMLFYVGVDLVMAVASGALSDASAPRLASFVIPRSANCYCHRSGHTPRKAWSAAIVSICNSHPDRHRRGFDSGWLWSYVQLDRDKSSRPVGRLSDIVRMDWFQRNFFMDQTEHAKRRRSRDRLRSRCTISTPAEKP